MPKVGVGDGEKKLKRFKLLRGRHATGRGMDGTRRIYRANEPGNNVVESEIDLAEKFGRQKFQPLDGEGDGNILEEAPDDALSGMTVPELKKFAEEEEIDVSGVRTKRELLETIRAALEAAE